MDWHQKTFRVNESSWLVILWVLLYNHHQVIISTCPTNTLVYDQYLQNVPLVIWQTLTCRTCAEIVQRSTRKQLQSPVPQHRSNRANYVWAKSKIPNLCCKDALGSMQLSPIQSFPCVFLCWHRLTWVEVIHLHGIWLQSTVCASWVPIILLNQ